MEAYIYYSSQERVINRRITIQAEPKHKTLLKKIKQKAQGRGSSSRVPTYQVRGPEFKPQYHQR
jgi:hypothetical protein